MIKRIHIEQVELIAFELAKDHFGYDEPIPGFSTRFPNSLESCVNAPFQTFDSRPLYRSLVDKASILFYLMIKNHPFQNGNKRIALTTLLLFLLLNGKWLDADSQLVYKIAT